MFGLSFVVFVFVFLLPFSSCEEKEIEDQKTLKIYFDQDVLAGSSNILSLLMLLRQHSFIRERREGKREGGERGERERERIEVVGVGVVGGDSHLEDALYSSLQAAEFTNCHEVPIARGSGTPFVNSGKLTHARLKMWGPKGGDNWLGEWGTFSPQPDEIRSVPNFDEPSVTPASQHAAMLLVDLARKYPGELVVVTAGPLTNIALALNIAPDIVSKIKAVYTMASAIHVRSKFNLWWDAESAAVFLRANWTKKVLVPIDVCQQTSLTRDLFLRSLPHKNSLYREWISQMFSEEWAEYDLPMWDELLVSILIDDYFGEERERGEGEREAEEEGERKLLEADCVEMVKKESSLTTTESCNPIVKREDSPLSLIEDRELVKERKRLYVDVDFGPGPNYGGTLWWEEKEHPKDALPPWAQPDFEPWEVITEINRNRFEEIFISMMRSDE